MVGFVTRPLPPPAPNLWCCLSVVCPDSPRIETPWAMSLVSETAMSDAAEPPMKNDANAESVRQQKARKQCLKNMVNSTEMLLGKQDCMPLSLSDACAVAVTPAPGETIRLADDHNVSATETSLTTAVPALPVMNTAGLALPFLPTDSNGLAPPSHTTGGSAMPSSSTKKKCAGGLALPASQPPGLALPSTVDYSALPTAASAMLTAASAMPTNGLERPGPMSLAALPPCLRVAQGHAPPPPCARRCTQFYCELGVALPPTA